MVQNNGLIAEMREANTDNIETLKGVGVSKDITEMDAYDPTQRVGTENDFSRDLGSGGARRSTQSGHTAVADIINDLPGGYLETPSKIPPKSTASPSGTQRDPAHVVNNPAKRISTSQVALTANAVQVAFATEERLSLVIVNRDAANALYIGASSALTAATGFAIDAGASMTLSINCELWALSPSGATIAIMEFLQ